jgi:hypothetical protein
VTQQLRHPGRRSDGGLGPEALSNEASQQACTVGGAEGSRAE